MPGDGRPAHSAVVWRSRRRQARQREILTEMEARRSREKHQEGAAGTVNRGRSAAIRTWAAEQGYELGSGRIPAAVIAAYYEATRPD
jgi:hypothetical protein